jgi:hypothetical protein
MIKTLKNFLNLQITSDIGDYVKLTYYININGHLTNKFKIIDKKRIYYPNKMLRTIEYTGVDIKGNKAFFNDEDISRNLKSNEIFPIDTNYEPINYINDTLNDYNI